MKIFIRGFNGAVFRKSGLININNDQNLIVFKLLIDKLRARSIDVKFFEDINSEIINSKIFFFDFPYSFDIRQLSQLVKELFSNKNQKVLVLFEPSIVAPLNYFKLLHRLFTKIYTWNDDLVDNKTYFKFHWPQSIVGYNTKPQPFKSRKFITLINGNKLSLFPSNPFTAGNELYSERIKAIEFFENCTKVEFDLYGRGWNKKRFLNFKDQIFGVQKFKTYKGAITNKIKILSRYKYCICFENLTNVNGYITEKIFDCFKARTIPIYLGASNIEEYIPEKCFIDFRKFNSYESLLKHLESISESEFIEYIRNIEKLLEDKHFFKRWFGSEFSKIFQ
jgi:hypothetical protein